MRAFVTSIGENTTELCVEQLKKFGFEVILLNGKEKWADKYTKFIKVALATGEDVLRVDADIIVNSKIDCAEWARDHGVVFIQYKHWDFYKNDIGQGNPVWYSNHALQTIKDNLKTIDPHRPETWASRLPGIQEFKLTSSAVVGIHGVAQNKEDMDRATKHKTERGQLGEFDFDLAYRIKELCKK